jgi:quercetin dioxygenase-like cupin family protein
MKTVLALSTLCLSVPLLVPGIGTAVAEKDEMGFVRVFPGQEQYKSPFGVGPASAVLHGDPTKPGIYVIRIHWPKNVMSRPHTHAQDRHVVVLSGTWYTGTGKAFEPEKSVPLKAGGYMMHPAGAVHWDGTREDEAVIQITGTGPVSTDLVDPSGPNFSQQ